MEDIMKMFHLRSMSAVSPYCSPRIAFLDPVFIKTWVNHFAQFDMGPKNFKFSSGFVDAFNGRYDDKAPTNLKWFIDVDHLYITHHIRPDHWAALDINLRDERIDVYDSIASLTSNNEVSLSCRPFVRMIPHVLNLLVPETIRKKKTAMFGVRRMKKIPQNIDVGDCGVYTVKYIERLALGQNFDDLCDANMPAFRLQLACDVFNELPVSEDKKTFTIPQLMDEDLEALDDDLVSVL